MYCDLYCDTRGVVARWWPSLEWAVEQELFSAKEAAEMLIGLIMEAEVVEFRGST